MSRKLKLKPFDNLRYLKDKANGCKNGYVYYNILYLQSAMRNRMSARLIKSKGYNNSLHGKQNLFMGMTQTYFSIMRELNKDEN